MCVCLCAGVRSCLYLWTDLCMSTSLNRFNVNLTKANGQTDWKRLQHAVDWRELSTAFLLEQLRPANKPNGQAWLYWRRIVKKPISPDLLQLPQSYQRIGERTTSPNRDLSLSRALLKKIVNVLHTQNQMEGKQWRNTANVLDDFSF